MGLAALATQTATILLWEGLPVRQGNFVMIRRRFVLVVQRCGWVSYASTTTVVIVMFCGWVIYANTTSL